MPIAYNPDTGKAWRLDNSGQWVDAPIATDPGTGKKLVFDGSAWSDFAPPSGRNMGEDALRLAGKFGAGFNESAIEAVGALPDLLGAGMRAVGVPGAPEKGFYTDTLKRGLQAASDFTRPVSEAIAPGVMEGPNSTVDDLAYGAGRGAADAASIMLPAAAVGNAAKAGGLTQRVSTALASQPVLQTAAGMAGGAVGQATDNPFLALAAAMAVPAGVAAAPRVAAPIRSQLSPNEANTARMAEGMGITLTPGQKTGSRPVLALESQLAKLPWSASRQQAIYNAQRSTLNKSVLAKAGIDADNVQPEIIDQAYKTLGQTMDDLAEQTRVRITPDFFDKINVVSREYGKNLETNVKPILQAYVDDLMQMKVPGLTGPTKQPMVPGQATPATAQVFIEGPEFQKIASGIKRAAREAQANPTLQNALRGLVDEIDDAMVKSADPDVAQGWREANRMYRNLLIIDDAVKGGASGDRVAGDIPIGSFKRAVQKKDTRGFSRGRGEFAKDVRVGEFINDRIPNSGTAERSAITGMITGAPLTGGAGAVIAGADPVTAGALAAGSYVLPPLVQALMNSAAGRAYLTNQSPARQQVMPLLSGLLAARTKDAALNPN
jgi:hypothetical protein